jgi:hypothetical protein
MFQIEDLLSCHLTHMDLTVTEMALVANRDKTIGFLVDSFDIFSNIIIIRQCCSVTEIILSPPP